MKKKKTQEYTSLANTYTYSIKYQTDINDAFCIVSNSNLTHRKIPSIINRLMCFLFPIYYEGRIAY
ncbi:hypothetical protein BK699_03315 [Bacillus thuringiensis serovar mexicanensis]|uniref:Uncharacterized protein n=1 Tax=Bacillus thuringiensis serovar mexicanensis TaxID=180868 RepID=A0A242WDR6_BACTU|nr:hypothetical protein BK699_03315 [Bacillus thuringiensis serovar mexicanensis]OTW98186.1 hypothetical protein BK705_23955 [Bacillus thuringiensis serovar monterrey]